FIKSLAYFRGESAVSLEDVRNMLPFVLHDKLAQNSDSPFFEVQQNAIFRVDKVNWIRKLFDLSCAEYDRYSLDNEDPVKELSDFFKKGLEGMSKAAVEEQLLKIENQMEQYVKNKKFHGYMFDDILNLKYLHQRYSNYLRWLKWKK
ncbi:MAG TPA: ATPase, partial [Spirochaetota bacterium]|nr:ATPase [Spirochaetota bacterium]